MTITIAIDGHSGSGKSTLAKQLAAKLGFIYIDTGALYRSVTLKVLDTLGQSFDEKSLTKLLNNTKVDIKQGSDGNRIFLDNTDVTDAIREPRVSNFVSQVSAQPIVRQHLITIQRDNAKKTNAILEGRDIGTVVLPKADFKFFITASIDARAQRRLMELKEKGISISLEAVKRNLIERDENDSKRKNSPLRKAEDAIEIDSSQMTADQKLNIVANYITNIQLSRKNRIYFFYKMMFRFLAKLFFRVKFYYEDYESVKLFSGILASNHCSNIDPPIVGNAIPYHIYYLAKEELVKSKFPILNILFYNHANLIPIDRDNPSPKSIKNILQRLKEGKTVLIFPEGTRSPDGTVQSGKTGPGLIAYKSKVNILPVYIDGTFNALPRGAKCFRFTKVSVVVGKPFTPDYELLNTTSKKEIYQEISKIMVDKIKDLKQTFENNQRILLTIK